MKTRIFLVLAFALIFIGYAHAQNVIFSDNFNDGSITDWNKANGRWHVSPIGFDLNGGNTDGSYIGHLLAMPSGSDYNISYQAKPLASVTNGSFFWFTSDQNSPGISSYELLLNDTNVLLRKIVSGTPTNLLTRATGVSVGSYHDVNITHGSDGNIGVLIDGVSLGSIIDVTYVTGTQIGYGTGNSDQNFTFDNLFIRSDLAGTAIVGSIMRPIDEKTNQPILKPWSIRISGLTGLIVDTNANSYPVSLVRDINQTNDILIDDNSLDEYFAREYTLSFSDDENTFTLQPYLIKRVDGSTVTFIVYDKITNVTLSNLLVAMRTTVGTDLNVLVEQRKTNANGSIALTMLDNQTYKLTITDVNGGRSYFPTVNTFNNLFTPNNIYVSATQIDVNVESKTWNISVAPRSESLLRSGAQKFDANIGTNYADYIQVIVLDGNIVVSNTLDLGVDFNFTTTFSTDSLDSNFITLKILIVDGFRTDVYIQTYRITSQDFSLGRGIDGFAKNTGTWGGIIITLSLIGLALQQFGGSLYGNNESQLFLVGLIMIASGILFFPDKFFPIIVALTIGVIVYLQLRS